MEPIHQASILDYKRKKRTIIIVAFVFSVAIGPFDIAATQRSFQARIVDLMCWFGVSVLFFSWCYFDSLQRNRPVTTGLRLLIVFLGIIGLCIYLINSRGLKQGLISSVKALGLFAGLVVVMTLTGVLVTAALDIPVPDI